jgi:hypothetical protein
LTSDFAAARLHLQRAYDYLRGNDEISHKTREAVDLLIEAVAVAEHRRPPARVLEFKTGAGKNRSLKDAPSIGAQQ